MLDNIKKLTFSNYQIFCPYCEWKTQIRISKKDIARLMTESPEIVLPKAPKVTQSAIKNGMCEDCKRET